MDEAEIIEANPHYMHICLQNGKETTLPLRDLIPATHVQNRLSKMQDFNFSKFYDIIRKSNSKHNPPKNTFYVNDTHKWNLNMRGGGPRGVMVKAMDYGIVVSDFVLQSRYYNRFRANTLGKGKNILILPAMG